jgi:hypothetical protein
LGFVVRRAAFTIAGAGRNVIAEVIDAHLEMASMIFLTTIWATVFAWFEGTAEDVGKWFHFFNLPFPLSLLGTFSTYHLLIGVSVFAISFSFGFLKFTRMLWARKRYLMFTALGNFAYAFTLEDFLYFFFSAPYARLTHDRWTCSILSLGCAELKVPWTLEASLVIPYWYFVSFTFTAVMFFLAYRSALVNLLVTREVMKQAGYLEKTRVSPTSDSAPSVELLTPPPSPAPATPPKSVTNPPEVIHIVDKDRDELVRRLREKLERT